MSSRIQPFNTPGFRLIKPGFGDSPTLSGIYTFGLSDPVDDNLFPMSGGNLRFPGALTWGNGWASQVAFFGNRAAVTSSPPAYQLISLGDTHNSIGGPGYFTVLEDNDPTWNGLFHSLATAWVAEAISYSNDTHQTDQHTATQFGRRSYDTFGASPINLPNVTRAGESLVAQIALWNSDAGNVRITERQTGYGQSEISLYNTEPGACGQWVTHWNNNALAPAAGDGPAWIIDIDGRFDAFTGGAAWQAYQRSGDPHVGGWGWRAFGLDAAGAMGTILDVNTDGGTLNGATIATLSPSAMPFESFLSNEVDLQSLSAGNVVVPARAGKRFVVNTMTVIVTQFGGTLTTGPTWVVKQGAAIINSASANAPSSANLATAGSVPARTNAFGTSAVAIPLNTATTFDITVAAVDGGGLVLMGKLLILGAYL
jgi:hypothetical protein